MQHSRPIGSILRDFVIAHIENERDPLERIHRIGIAHKDGHLSDEEAAQWIAVTREAA